MQVPNRCRVTAFAERRVGAPIDGCRWPDRRAPHSLCPASAVDRGPYRAPLSSRSRGPSAAAGRADSETRRPGRQCPATLSSAQTEDRISIALENSAAHPQRLSWARRTDLLLTLVGVLLLTLLWLTARPGSVSEILGRTRPFGLLLHDGGCPDRQRFRQRHFKAMAK